MPEDNGNKEFSFVGGDPSLDYSSISRRDKVLPIENARVPSKSLNSLSFSDLVSEIDRDETERELEAKERAKWHQIVAHAGKDWNHYFGEDLPNYIEVLPSGVEFCRRPRCFPGKKSGVSGTTTIVWRGITEYFPVPSIPEATKSHYSVVRGTKEGDLMEITQLVIEVATKNAKKVMDRMADAGYEVSEVGAKPKRGIVSGFSAKSRQNLVRKLVRSDFSGCMAKTEDGGKHKSFFVTLTYHNFEAVEGKPKLWKEHLNSFRKRVERWIKKELALKGGKGLRFAIWKLESQEKRAYTLRVERKKQAMPGERVAMPFIPHFHILISFSQFVKCSRFKRFCKSAWNGVTNESELHLEHGADSIPAYQKEKKGRAALLGYLAKYLGKEVEKAKFGVGKSCVGTGRAWGEWKKVPEQQGVRYAISDDLYKRACAAASAGAKCLGSNRGLEHVNTHWSRFFAFGSVEKGGGLDWMFPAMLSGELAPDVWIYPEKEDPYGLLGRVKDFHEGVRGVM